MAKGGNDGWIAAKPMKKGGKIDEVKSAKSSTPVAQVKTAEYSPPGGAKKDEKKKKTGSKKPRNDKQPFTIKGIKLN